MTSASPATAHSSGAADTEAPRTCTLLAIGFAASAFGRGFRLYSIATLVIILVSGGLTGLEAPNMAANLPTPWIGIAERIDLGGYLLWVAVLASALLREPASGQRRERAGRTGG
jgi:hypothetical protein